MTYLTEFFELENYGIALWKEFGDDVKEPFEAMMKMLDEPECIEDRWLDEQESKRGKVVVRISGTGINGRIQGMDSKLYR
mgnify:CR=1 FL=1